MLLDLPAELFGEVVKSLSPLDVAVLVQCSWECLHRLQGFEMPSLHFDMDLLEARRSGPWKWTIAPVGERFEVDDEWVDAGLAEVYAEHFPQALLSVRHVHLTCSSGDFWPGACKHLDLFINCRSISSIAFEGLHFESFAQEITKLTQLEEIGLDSSYDWFSEEDFEALLELVTKHKLVKMNLLFTEKEWIQKFAEAGKWQGLQHLVVRFCPASEFRTLVGALSNDSLRELVLWRGEDDDDEEEEHLTLDLAKKICRDNGLVACAVTRDA